MIFFVKNGKFLAVFLDFGQERCFVEGCCFLRCVQCPKTLNLSYQNNIWKYF